MAGLRGAREARAGGGGHRTGDEAAAEAATVIYLDHHATTPCDPRVVETMLPYFTEHFGNPASITHHHGRKASMAIEESRLTLARFFHVVPPEIYFTAGATESNNIALNLVQPGQHLVTSLAEHKSIVAPAERMAKHGVEVTFLAPDREGFIRADAVRDALRPNTRLVSIEAANGEVGTIQAIDAIGAACRERGVLFHTDATQAAGKVPLSFANVDLASLSAHKLYGPKGVGALFVRRGIRIEPVIVGGGQERNVRSGTVNVPAVVGFGAALQLRAAEMGEEAIRLTALREWLREKIVEEIEGSTINGPRELRLPGNLNVSFDRIEADSLILAMKRFSLSSGSACSSGDRGPSRVLKAMGASDAAAMGSIRFGLGASNTQEQVTMLLDDLRRVVRRLREITPA
ncbi:MAG TPA: cysteine desulfurase family protein [Thermoanaerobaculia bacterium]|nr:cysteine desulfurase family protein [Thermoanaerobaculia bacterium]